MFLVPMIMANSKQTTFEDFQIDERFKKLERSLKLAVLRKAHSDNGEVLLPTTGQSSISSINMDSLDCSYVTPSLQTSVVKSEVLASSNNLRNLLLTKRSYNNREIMATSSVKQYNVKQDAHLNDRHIMPPPIRNTVYRTSKETQDKVLTDASNSLNGSAHNKSSTVNTLSLKSASYISTNSNTNKEYKQSLVASISDLQRIDRIFLKWRVLLNDHYELIIKGTLECGRVARSKPVIRRYSATCVESKYKHKYILEGNIVDERNVLPNYIREKFYNGFPDDWENVHQIWKTYISQGCPVTFRWPTPITDSDDDLKSELTELTYIRMTNNKTIPMETHKSIECIKSKSSSNKSSKNEEKYQNCSTHSIQRCKENASSVKPLFSNLEKDIIPIAQTRNVKLAHDENNKQDIENSVFSSGRMNKLKDIIHEDKLHIIINNLADRNCSPKYIDKIIEMFECLDYVMSYRAKSECNDDSAVFVNCGTSSKLDAYPLQSSLSRDDNCMTTNKLENDVTKQWKTDVHSTSISTDSRYRRIKNDSNDSNQFWTPINIKSKHDNNSSDELESETYTSVPKIFSKVERVLQARKVSGKMYKHKLRKKSSNSQRNKGIKYERSAHTVTSIANNNKSLLSDESGISITEDEVKVINTRKCHEINIAQKSQGDTFCSHSEIRRNNFDVNRPAVQTEQPLDAFEKQKITSNAFIKEQKVPFRVEENARSQFTDVDIDYNSDIDVATVSTNTRDGNAIGSHLDQDIVVISSESNSNFPEKPLVSRELHREFIEQPRSETAMKRSKPSIISSVPVNLKLKIKKADSKSEQLQYVSIVENEEDKRYINDVHPLEVQKKKCVSKTAVDDKKKIYPTNKETNESNMNPVNLTKPTMRNSTGIEQYKSNELESHPKVLCAWMPKVIYYAKSKSELGLTFEGKLLNEAGHVVHRKFTTDIVLKRLSATLIETVNHEFYQLSGYLKDNKHVIHKELAKQCRNGCPTKIQQFCLTWKRLQNCEMQKIREKPHNVSVDLLNTSISSRGRRIVPPLSYWTGERVALKDNNLVYDPGNSLESSFSLIETSKEAMSTEETKKPRATSKNTSKKQKLLSKSNEIPDTNKNHTIVIEKIQSSNKSPKTKAANGTKRPYKSNKSRKSRINGRRHIKQNLTFSSTDSSEEEQKILPSKRMHIQPNTETPSQYTMTLRKRYDRDIPE
ncbi:uncharacterized protein [Anoplolepis gracilipes]|uniref:uncharacterized protein isoform X2 n=1 Tax=Anoplolepis gracilipes TaxID=354296 RepID=UPI003BA04773